MRGEVSTLIDAPPERVFDLVSDLERMGEWSPECERIEWLNGRSQAEPGAKFRGHNRRGPYRWTADLTVLVADRPTEIAFCTGSPDDWGTVWRYMFEPEGDQTRVIESFEITSGLARWEKMAIRLGRRLDLVRGMQKTLSSLKQAVEA